MLLLQENGRNVVPEEVKVRNHDFVFLFSCTYTHLYENMNLIENISVVKLNLHNLQCNNLQQNLQKNQADLEENAGRKKIP